MPGRCQHKGAGGVLEGGRERLLEVLDLEADNQVFIDNQEVTEGR